MSPRRRRRPASANTRPKTMSVALEHLPANPTDNLHPSATPPDARPQTPTLNPGHLRWACLRAEPAPRPLRTRSRGTGKHARRYSVHRARPRHLRRRTVMASTRHLEPQCNNAGAATRRPDDLDPPRRGPGPSQSRPPRRVGAPPATDTPGLRRARRAVQPSSDAPTVERDRLRAAAANTGRASTWLSSGMPPSFAVRTAEPS